MLSSLVEQALLNNNDIAIAAARVREAEATERQARAQLFPTVNAGATAAHSRSLGVLGSPTVSSNAEPQLQAAWQVDLLGGWLICAEQRGHVISPAKPLAMLPRCPSRPP
ncbi:TolC family protein [Novosphingobium panipatense]